MIDILVHYGTVSTLKGNLTVNLITGYGYYCWCCLEKPIRIARQKPLLYKFDIHQSLESFANISPKHILLNSNVICSNIFNFSTLTQDCGLPLNFKYILV